MKHHHPLIEAFHGSPGTPSDFTPLQAALAPKIQLYPRKRGQKDKPGSCALGYSFGAALALIEASHSKTTERVILVAPYLFPAKKPSALTKGLLSLPVAGHLLLNAMGPKSIEKMLVDSCSGENVPAAYRAQAEIYCRPETLKESVLEKNIDAKKIGDALARLAERKVAIDVIWGENDRTSSFQDQIAPLLSYPHFHLVKVPGAPHALLWTHTEAVASHIAQIVAKGQSQRLGYFEGKSVQNNVYSFLHEHLKKNPDHPILSYVSREETTRWLQAGQMALPIQHQSITVRELDHLVNHTAEGFKNIGISSGDRVILFVPMSVFLYNAMFALQKIGAIPVFLDSWARRDQLGISAKVADPKALISFEQAFQYLKGVPELDGIPIKVVVGPTATPELYQGQLEQLTKTPKAASTQAVEREHTALITFTTGSSGVPKGADRSHRFLAAQHYALNRHLPYQNDDRDLPVFPIFSLNNLAAGATTIIPAIDVGTPAAHDAAVLVAQMKSASVTCTTLSPSLLNAVSAHCLKHNVDLSFLKRIVTGGAPVSRDDLIKIKQVAPAAEILVLYGSTEVEPMAHIEAAAMINQKTRSMEDPEWVDEGVNVGELDSGLEYRFLKISKEPIFIKSDDDWKKWESAPGEAGELAVAGEHVCQGYFNNEDAFFRAKIRDHHGKVWHRTGDLGRLDAHQQLWLVGRVHNAIKRRDGYCFPVRAEIILKKLPYVRHAAYLGVAGEAGFEKAVCVIAPHPHEIPNPSAWKADIERLMAKNGMPVDGIVIKEKIPMDPRHHSKVEYDALRKEIEQQEL